ncbi:MAG: hypothetical protein COY68_00605 [Candidatus Levybacteria bacterium CG_4_10_14_0_8_um_filter_35_23]|nr:MAG: hypothetical protein COY68_00605 [Candidatus Levybacteria bacterium CG_4_10_14_0_8_um_filter_35_23]
MDITHFLNFRNRWQLVKDVAIWFLSGFILLAIGNFIENLPQKYLSFIQNYIINPLDPIKIAAFFLLLVLLFLVLKDLFRQIIVLWYKNKIYIFNSKDWPSKWVFHGKSEIVNNDYLFIKSSRAGCLLKNYYWKNFRMSFEMKFSPDNFRNQKLISLIFRAEDLDNYFMIEIGENAEHYEKVELNVEKNKEEMINIFVSSIKPHVRYMGGWEIMAVEEMKKPFDFSEFIEVSLEVKEDTVYLFYKKDLVFSWILPKYVDVNHIESGVRDNREKEKVVMGGAFVGHVQKIPFRLAHGMIGFRAHVRHGAIIRNLKVEPL